MVQARQLPLLDTVEPVSNLRSRDDRRSVITTGIQNTNWIRRTERQTMRTGEQQTISHRLLLPIPYRLNWRVAVAGFQGQGVTEPQPQYAKPAGCCLNDTAIPFPANAKPQPIVPVEQGDVFGVPQLDQQFGDSSGNQFGV